MSLNCIIIGAGNLATHLGSALKQNGFRILQVYSRTEFSAKSLSETLNAGYTNSPENIIEDADVYFVALKDSVIDDVLSQIKFFNKLVVLCSGSVPLATLKNYSENSGVIYPLQTFSKSREIDFSQIPLFIEANNEKNLSIIKSIASKLSGFVKEVDSEKRKTLHIAAVYACNFVNHLYTLSENILNEDDLSFDVLKPLITETTSKIMSLSPEEAQTGPAVRFDETIINDHIRSLSDKPDLKELYKLISKSIFMHHQKIK